MFSYNAATRTSESGYSLMNSRHITNLSRSMAFAALSTFFVTANAQTEMPSILKDLSVTGYVDMYYSYDFGKPMSGANVLGGSGRQFDVANNQFGFAALALNINKKITADNPFGFTIGVLLGKNADILNAFEPAGPNSSFKNLSQAYVSYAVPKSPVTVDLGKFLTWIGYEGLASADNDNYSRSFLYYYSQPVYHTGVRASGTLPGGLTAAVAAVNGWNEVDDSNAGKGYGASLSGTFGKTTVTGNYYGGNEGSAKVNGFGSGGVTSVQLADLIVVHQLTPTVKLALNADYGQAKPTETDANAAHGKFSGIAGYVKATFTSVLSGGLRYEVFTDKNGIRTGAGPTGARLTEVTGNLDYNVSKDALFRVELRYDKSNRSLFPSDDTGGTSKERTTLSFSHVLKF